MSQRPTFQYDASRAGARARDRDVAFNDVAAGGETSFDKLGVAVAPRRGAACVFFPADADSHRADDRTTHASLPAVDTKWICQVWRRARRVPPPLGLPADAS